MVLPNTAQNVALESQWKPAIAKLVILSILYASYLGVAVAQSGSDMQGMPTLAPMLERVTPAVVNIATTGRIPAEQNPLFNDPFFRDFFGAPGQPLERKTQSLGSGVIVDAERGLILTNAEQRGISAALACAAWWCLGLHGGEVQWLTRVLRGAHGERTCRRAWQGPKQEDIAWFI